MIPVYRTRTILEFIFIHYHFLIFIMNNKQEVLYILLIDFLVLGQCFIIKFNIIFKIPIKKGNIFIDLSEKTEREFSVSKPPSLPIIN